MSESQVSVPLPVRLRFGHAAVQHLAAADRGRPPPHQGGCGRSVASARRLRGQRRRRARAPGARRRPRPGDAAARMAPLQHLRVRLAVRPRADLPARRVGLHRPSPLVPRHPAASPSARSTVFWSDRHELEIAGIGCQVPSVPAQAVLLVLNAARSRTRAKPDVGTAWRDADEERRAEVDALVVDLDARVAFAAATGGLERYRRRAGLPAVEDRLRGRGRARPSGGRACARRPTCARQLRIAARAPLVNVDHLAHRLGRAPTRGEIVAEFFRRPAQALREAWPGRPAAEPADERAAAPARRGRRWSRKASSTRRASRRARSSCSRASPR